MITKEQQQIWLSKGYDPSTFLHRDLLVSIVAKHAQFETLIDVGCSTGPDLALYELVFPNAKLTGFDVNAGDVEIARGKLASDFTTKVYHADLRQHLLELPDKSFDIVVSNGVMMYNDSQLLKELPRIAKRAVILSERDQYKGGRIAGYLEECNIPFKATKITKEIRHSWADDGYIYEITL